MLALHARRSAGAIAARHRERGPLGPGPPGGAGCSRRRTAGRQQPPAAIAQRFASARSSSTRLLCHPLTAVGFFGTCQAAVPRNRGSRVCLRMGLERKALLHAAPAHAVRYERRRPEHTLLHRLLREHLESFLAEGLGQDRHGPARVPVRQWVLSFPIGLRILLAARPHLLTPVLRIVHRVIAGFVLSQAGLKRATGLPKPRAGEHLLAASGAPTPTWGEPGGRSAAFGHLHGRGRAETPGRLAGRLVQRQHTPNERLDVADALCARGVRGQPLGRRLAGRGLAHLVP